MGLLKWPPIFGQPVKFGKSRCGSGGEAGDGAAKDGWGLDSGGRPAKVLAGGGCKSRRHRIAAEREAALAVLRENTAWSRNGFRGGRHGSVRQATER